MFNIQKLKDMQKLRVRVANHEDVFTELPDDYLQSFLITIASESVNDDKNFVDKYWALRRALLALEREKQVEICEKFFLKEEQVNFCENFETILVGDTWYQIKEKTTG